MRKLLCVLISVIVCAGVMLTGCSQTSEKSPDEYTKVRWITPNYSFSFTPSDDCKGKYTFNDKTYDIQAEFTSPARVTVYDLNNSNTELFNGQWMYKEEGLFIYDIIYNTEDYSEFERCYDEFVTLKKEKL